MPQQNLKILQNGIWPYLINTCPSRAHSSLCGYFLPLCWLIQLADYKRHEPEKLDVSWRIRAGVFPDHARGSKIPPRTTFEGSSSRRWRAVLTTWQELFSNQGPRVDQRIKPYRRAEEFRVEVVGPAKPTDYAADEEQGDGGPPRCIGNLVYKIWSKLTCYHSVNNIVGSCWEG